MTDFGGRLRDARQRRGISIGEIAATTKIPSVTLEALERNEVSRLPGGIFSRAIVRAYAGEVGLPPEETLRDFLARFAPEPVPSAAEAAQAEREELGSIESRQRVAALVVVVVLASVVMAAAILLLTSRRSSDLTAAAPPIAAEPEAGLDSADDGAAPFEDGSAEPAPELVPPAAPGVRPQGGPAAKNDHPTESYIR